MRNSGPIIDLIDRFLLEGLRAPGPMIVHADQLVCTSELHNTSRRSLRGPISLCVGGNQVRYQNGSFYFFGPFVTIDVVLPEARSQRKGKENPGRWSRPGVKSVVPW